MEEVDKEISEMKLSLNARARVVAESYLSAVSSTGSLVSGSSSIGGGGYPAPNAQGQRICRQCGLPGRYKDGKCVEKWGPGPEGPGTVCDRCVLR